jgi:hypothetical protein
MTVTVRLDLTDQEADRYQDWNECAAFRIIRRPDGTATLQVTSDLELITRPEGAGRGA